MSFNDTSFIQPNWPAPASIRAYASTRIGGISRKPFDSLNLGAHVQDDIDAVRQNRHLFCTSIKIPNSVTWLNQVHGVDVANLPCDITPESADAAFSNVADQVCAVLTADCLPVFFCNESGTQVAVAHAGWRGLCTGVLESTLECFEDKSKVMIWLGPAIGPAAFEVGEEVRDAFMSKLPEAIMAFEKSECEGKWLGDLYLLARQRLTAAGVNKIYGGDRCTFTESETFFSYRRDGKTGRMASVIWIDA